MCPVYVVLAVAVNPEPEPAQRSGLSKGVEYRLQIQTRVHYRVLGRGSQREPWPSAEAEASSWQPAAAEQHLEQPQATHTAGHSRSFLCVYV